MPDKESKKIQTLSLPFNLRRGRISKSVDYSELQVTTNFSLLSGASHPEEYVFRAVELGYRAIGIADCNTLAGVVRAHLAAVETNFTCLIGSTLELQFQAPALAAIEKQPPLRIIVYPCSLSGYQALCRLLSLGKMRAPKDECRLTLEEYFDLQHDFIPILIPPPLQTTSFPAELLKQHFIEAAEIFTAGAKERSLLSLACTKNYQTHTAQHLNFVYELSRRLGLPLLATNDVYYHIPQRRPLQDVLTCIKNHCTLPEAGSRLFQNSERYLKTPEELAYLFSDLPEALTRTRVIAEAAAQFSLSQLKYDYPEEVCPSSKTPLQYLTELTWAGAAHRYPEGVPPKVRAVITQELPLIHELGYEKYFLTCYDIVGFARSRGILCQGRGSAANSAVCFCLGITAVDPARIDLLFARFISKERHEPPDIDIDFEHERREEVIQYIYEKYGRERAALTAEVISYRQRSALRDVGKVMGLSAEILNQLSKSLHHWTDYKLDTTDLQALGLDPYDRTIQNTLNLCNQLLGFPRHLSQHVGGFIISARPLVEIVPIRNAAMAGRTIIEWDKDDIEALGILKIDILALGILSCIRKCLVYINQRRSLEGAAALELATIPPEDSRVYDSICAGDTIGVFQIESRAQMSMLPRLRPRCFYDLVIEVAIVRPGPIQGNMVHPFLRRRNGAERIEFPDQRVSQILARTLGVPLFQEQAMRLAIVLAGFTPGEAEQLRRSLAAWKRNRELIACFKERIVAGMLVSGYSKEFAETCMQQMQGFSEYGFPESHAASFALLVYASAWLKHYYPAEFAAALINSQPLGFYAPAQIVEDAKRHQVELRPIDFNFSSWDCSLEKIVPADHLRQPYALRLGLRLVRGLQRTQVEMFTSLRGQRLFPEYYFQNIFSFWQEVKNTQPAFRLATLAALAHSDAFASIGLDSRRALWEISALPREILPLDSFQTQSQNLGQLTLPFLSKAQAMFQDYKATGLSLKAHPLSFLRSYLLRRSVYTADEIRTNTFPSQTTISVAGLLLFRQRPPTAKGVVFLTIEDETGIINLIVRPEVFAAHQRLIIQSRTFLARGCIERSGEVIYINARHLESLDLLLGQAALPLETR